jgi:hypothetical protein
MIGRIGLALHHESALKVNARKFAASFIWTSFEAPSWRDRQSQVLRQDLEVWIAPGDSGDAKFDQSTFNCGQRPQAQWPSSSMSLDSACSMASADMRAFDELVDELFKLLRQFR